MSSHLFDLTAICAAGGLPFASAQAARFREQIMGCIEQLSGHRFFRGFNTIGGVSKDISSQQFEAVVRVLKQLRKEFETWHNLVLSHEGLLDRLETTGFLSTENVEKYSFVGPVARGSDVERDLRQDFPYGIYAQHPFEISTSDECDVFSRTNVRIKEVTQSIELILSWIQVIPNGDLSVQWSGSLPAYDLTYSAVESAKGDLIHCLMVDNDQKITRWHFRSAPYMNWRAVVLATMGNNIVPDGPLVNKSFNLCYSCCDK